jgi:DNA-binding NarL/FixJ family response regulator
VADLTAPASVRVALVDDDPLVRAGLRLLLAGHPVVQLVAEAADGDEVPALVAEHHPDVILMDVRMRRTDGVAAVRQLGGRPPVIMLTTFDADETVLAAVRAGAVGFLVKHAPPDEIVAAVQRVAAGEPSFSPSVVGALVRHARTADEPDPGAQAFGSLSDRERDIARSVARGSTNAEIAAELYLSAGTVKAEVSALLNRLGLQNRIQLAVLAHRQLGLD